MKSIDQLDISGKKVFIRVDFNVPTDDQGNITDDTRIRAHLATINYADRQGRQGHTASLTWVDRRARETRSIL